MYINSGGFIATLVQWATGSDFIALLVRVSHRYREGTGYNTVEDPNFFSQATYGIA